MTQWWQGEGEVVSVWYFNHLIGAVHGDYRVQKEITVDLMKSHIGKDFFFSFIWRTFINYLLENYWSISLASMRYVKVLLCFLEVNISHYIVMKILFILNNSFHDYAKKNWFLNCLIWKTLSNNTIWIFSYAKFI